MSCPSVWLSRCALHLPDLKSLESLTTVSLPARPQGVMDEIVYQDRLDPYNHYPPWREYITGIVDTLPIFVSEPAHFPAAKLLYQPKYKRHCYKMQLGITFAGNIILWTGPHFGSTADITIWRDTWAHHPFRSWEAWLADLGYCGAIGLITKYKRQRRRRRTDPRIPFTQRTKHPRRMSQQSAASGGWRRLGGSITGAVTVSCGRRNTAPHRACSPRTWPHVSQTGSVLLA